MSYIYIYTYTLTFPPVDLYAACPERGTGWSCYGLCLCECFYMSV